jgi:hypothetical protein
MRLIELTALGTDKSVYVNPEAVVAVFPEKTASASLHLSTGESLIVEGDMADVVKKLSAG